MAFGFLPSTVVVVAFCSFSPFWLFIPIPFSFLSINRQRTERLKKATTTTEAFTCEYEYEPFQMVFASLVSNSVSLTIFRIQKISYRKLSMAIVNTIYALHPCII